MGRVFDSRHSDKRTYICARMRIKAESDTDGKGNFGLKKN